MKKDKTENLICGVCHSTFKPGAEQCSLCGSPISKAKLQEKFGVVSVILNFVLGFFSTIFNYAFIMSLFIYFVIVDFSSYFVTENDSLYDFMSSSSPVIIVGAFAFILIFLIFCLNIHRIRRFFLSLGISSIVLCMINIFASIFKNEIISLFPNDWSDYLNSISGGFADYTILCIIALVVLATTCFTVYSCIHIIRKVVKDDE